MTMAIKRYTRLEMSFNAVERVVEFMEIEQESPAITDKRPPPEVSCYCYCFCYTLLNFLLKKSGQ